MKALRAIAGVAVALLWAGCGNSGESVDADAACPHVEVFRLYDADAGCSRASGEYTRCTEGAGPPCERCSQDSSGDVYLSNECHIVPGGSSCSSELEAVVVGSGQCP